MAERGGLVKDGECVAHTAVGLLGNHGKCLFLVGDTLLLGHMLQVVYSITDGHPLEVVNLTTAEDSRQDFVLLRCGEDEDDVCGRLLKGLEESVEGGGGEHVHLVNDKDFITSELRWNARLLHERLDVLHGVVGGGIELKNVERTLFVERLTTLTGIASLTICRRILAVDGLGKDACASGLSHASGTAEEVGMCQFSALHGILQRRG